MTKYLTEERFIVQSSSKESLRNYRDGWERTFGEKKDEPTPEQQAVRDYLAAGGEPSPIGLYGVIVDKAPAYTCEACCDTGCVVDPNADPSTFVTEADGLVNCDECSIRGKQLP